MATSRLGLSCAWHLQQALRRSLQSSLPSVNISALPATALGVQRSAQSGVDYQTSVALQLGSRKKKSKICVPDTDFPAPEELANSIVNNLSLSIEEQCPLLKNVFVTKGGFVNLVLHDEWVARQAVHMAIKGILPVNLPSNEQKNILVDFAAPNMGKKLHVGHLRSSVLGDTICNLLEFRGHRVARISHTGDVGSALATLIVELMEQQVTLETLTDAELGKYYEMGKRRLILDTAFKLKVDHVVLQLQLLGTDSEVDINIEKTWIRACQVSREAYQRIFDRLGVTVYERGESTYMTLVPKVIKLMESNGLAVASQGALGIFLDGPDKPPMLIRKSDGGFLYATVDLTCLYSRIHGFPGVDKTLYDEIIYVTDQSQQLHFKHLFATAKQAGWTKRHGKDDVKLTHAAFGLVLGNDGTKLSSRNGAFDYLEDLLNGAAAECSRQSLASATTGAVSKALSLTQEQIDTQNRLLGDAAVRYFELAQQRERNYKFILDNVLNLKGNTGVYLMYASARLHGILRKASGSTAIQTSWDSFLGFSDDALAAQNLLAVASIDWHPSERALALLLSQFDDEVAATLSQLYPHYLCEYLFRVASQFHSFYESCRVLQNSRQDSRLLLCAITDAVLRRGLQLVGVAPVDRM
ncbi:arginine-trna ligase [Plasmopara halstedii]|uniref:arginine--tRNA ligase n=1 Tax=Plasmopara halstedii TaxID=4781 RepID=A0A0P1ABD4_PLAHL|nr:arginine-trna ligase [Plasmopara halstedii]CEG38066.1 arginine-trna ligase [Plasmopara halstedii]|eukprot:XP_024574435.1 arginine-trna ligase [Plasmopara halstedii]